MANQSQTHEQKTKGGPLDIHEKDVTHIATEADLKAGKDTAAKPSTHAENTKRADR
jgi:hypothetical protein